jgi:hypothetical protein
MTGLLMARKALTMPLFFIPSSEAGDSVLAFKTDIFALNLYF